MMSDVVKFGEHTDGAICVYVRYNPDFTEPTSGIFLTRNSTDEEFTSSVPTDFTMYDKTDAGACRLVLCSCSRTVHRCGWSPISTVM